MTKLTFPKLSEVNHNAMLDILNKASTRKHLIPHPLFSLGDVDRWIKGKLEVDTTHGCKVRAIDIDGKLIGWCGIQRELDEFELAIVIDDSHWGLGKRIFTEMMHWARYLGHKTVCIHLLQTRRKYKFLESVADMVCNSTMMGARFTTYKFTVTQGT